MIASALLILAAANAARAQTSTASLFPVGFMDDGLQGEVVGTGADGTTYVLSATFDELDVPYTMTLVEDATHVSITAGLETAGVTVPIDVQCAMGGGDAVCRQVVGEGIDATTFTESGVAVLTGVPIGGGGSGGPATGSATRSTGPSITFSSSSSSATATGGGGTELPPILSLDTTATAASGPAGSEATSTDSPFGAGADTGSGALKNGIVVLGGLVVPAVLVFLNTF